MHLRSLTGTTAISLFAAMVGLCALLGLMIFLTNQAFAQSNSAPDFGATTATRSVDEYTGSNVLNDRPWYGNIGDPVTATDADNDKLTYSIKNTRTSPFYIDRDNGQLQVGTPLDYETGSSYSVTVVATDPSRASDKITVTITVSDVEEAGTVSFYWERPQVSTALKATLADGDGNITSESWQWSKADNRNGTFANISSAASDTYTPVAVDIGKYLKVTVNYNDGNGTGKTASAVSRSAVRAVPSSNNTPVYNLNHSGGYRCPNGVDADYCLSVPRKSPIGANIYYPGGASDPDRADDLRYTLEGTDKDSFSIDHSNGNLYTEISFNDVEDSQDYLVTVRASDETGASATANIKLKPSGSKTSPVVKGPKNITYPENGTWQLATYTAYNRRGGQDVALRGWIISVQPGGGDGDFFDIDDNGVLYFTQPPDFDDPADDNGDNVYSFSVHVYDTNPPRGQRPGQSFYSVSVRVVNVDEDLEINGPTSVDYAEKGTDPVHTYTVTGAEGPVSWSLEGGDSNLFSIDNNGTLSFNDSPNYEEPFDSSDAPSDQNDYLLSIVVTDGGSTSKLEPVRIMVTNVNEPPAFPESEDGRRTVSEDAGANEDIGDPITAEDPDGDGLTYTLGGTDALSFDIDPYTGQLKTAAELDFETQTSYSLTVAVTDGRDAAGNTDDLADDTINVTITVTGANEAPAIIGESTIDYPETSTLPVYDYSATDPENDAVTWSLKEVDDYDDLSIDSATGVLTFDSPPDYEDSSNPDHQYQVTVVATDTNSNSSELDVTINVTPVNDPPVITYNGNTGAQTISYDENGTSAVATIIATDQENNPIEWKLLGTDAGDLSISNAGVLSFNASPDYETPVDDDTNNAYEITVEAKDGTNTAIMDVTVNVGNVDEKPVVTGNAGPSVVEGSTDTIASYGATDPEEGQITWLNPTGADGSLFEIAAGGELSFKAAPDYESPGSANGSNVYQVTVNASDDANTGSLAVTVTVVDNNEAIVREGTWTTDINYPENSNTTVATYAASDPEGENINWDLNGNDDDKLSISSAGVLTFNTIPNFESAADDNTDNVYEITVVASDGINKETQDVRITVTNINEAPVLTFVREVTFAEGGTGTVVTFEVTDPDANATITWSLSGDDVDDFNDLTKPTNEPMKGELTFKNVPDREDPTDADTNSEYKITVTATDEGGLDDEMDVTVVVSNEDETPNISGPTEFEYLENAHHTAATYNAVDPEDDDITWTLLGHDEGLFTLNPLPPGASTALLTFRSAPDFETKRDHDTNNVYEVTIQAKDDNPDHVQNRDVKITVTDVNETPVIDALTPEDYLENGTGDVADFSATDPDDGDTIEWSLSGDDDEYFSIHEDTGVLTFNDPTDYEFEVDGSQKNVYSITVQASDDEFMASLDVTVTVTGVDETPVISGETDLIISGHTFEYAENGTDLLHTFTAPDPERATIIWKLDGADRDDFTIDGGVL